MATADAGSRQRIQAAGGSVGAAASSPPRGLRRRPVVSPGSLRRPAPSAPRSHSAPPAASPRSAPPARCPQGGLRRRPTSALRESGSAGLAGWCSRFRGIDEKTTPTRAQQHLVSDSDCYATQRRHREDQCRLDNRMGRLPDTNLATVRPTSPPPYPTALGLALQHAPKKAPRDAPVAPIAQAASATSGRTRASGSARPPSNSRPSFELAGPPPGRRARCRRPSRPT